MAQRVRITMEVQPGPEGILPGASNYEVPEDVEPTIELELVSASYTSTALLRMLERLEKRGIGFDGPLTIRVEKVAQVGGSDGVVQISTVDGGLEWRLQ